MKRTIRDIEIGDIVVTKPNYYGDRKLGVIVSVMQYGRYGVFFRTDKRGYRETCKAKNIEVVANGGVILETVREKLQIPTKDTP